MQTFTSLPVSVWHHKKYSIALACQSIADLLQSVVASSLIFPFSAMPLNGTSRFAATNRSTDSSTSVS